MVGLFKEVDEIELLGFETDHLLEKYLHLVLQSPRVQQVTDIIHTFLE